VERTLADIDADHGDCAAEFPGHGELLTFDAPCQFGFMAGLEHGPDHPILGHYRIAAIALHRYREALQLSGIMLRHRCIGRVPEKGCKTVGTTGIVVARFLDEIAHVYVFNYAD